MRVNSTDPEYRQVIAEMVRREVDRTGCTIAGWYWYCDECDTHGNADTEAEAWTIARAHEQFQSSVRLGDAECELCVFRVGKPDPPDA